jgi:hypothetical protein
MSGSIALGREGGEKEERSGEKRRDAEKSGEAERSGEKRREAERSGEKEEKIREV